MSLLSIKREFRKDWKDNYDHFKPISFDASVLILPYSIPTEKFIYTGEEKMPFIQRDSEFQLILRKEFASIMKKVS